MKTLRRIGIIVIVALALAFTACDDILEVFYPDFASDEGVDFGIGIWIQIEVPADQVTGDPLLAGRVETMWGEVIGGSERFVYPEWIWDDRGNLLLQGFIEFGITDPGEYRVPIWLETNNNEWPDFDEPVFFARWQSDPGNDPNFWDDIFRFGKEFDITWINGEAILGGFERLNYNFRVKNANHGGDAFVMQATDIGEQRYLVETDDENLLYVDRTWRLINLGNEEREIVDENYTHYPEGVSSETFSIDYNLYTTDEAETADYLLEIELFYMDGGWAFASVPVRIIFQEFEGAPFDLNVNVHESDWDPLRLIIGKNYGVFVQVRTQGGGAVSEFWAPDASPDESGVLSMQVAGLNYNPAESVDPDIDFVFLYIDVAGGDGIGPGDWFLRVPLGLASGETKVTYDYKGWMLMPLFNVVWEP